MGVCLIVPKEEALKNRYAVMAPLGKGVYQCWPKFEDLITTKPSVIRSIEAGFRKPVRK